MASKPVRLQSKPGIYRDGTALDSVGYTDGEWVRFYRGRPRKIGGYREIADNFTGPVRGVHTYPRQLQNTIHTFSPSTVEQVLVDGWGIGAAVADRTPAGFTARTDYAWQFDTFYDSAGGGKVMLVAHPGRNLGNIDNNLTTDVYYGEVNAAAALTTTSVAVSGGLVSIQPYLVLYGSNGVVMNSNTNSPTNFTTGQANTANVAATKIVKGLPIRGSGNAPAALLWSLDSVIRMYWVGGGNVFEFDTVSSQSSILSSSAVIEYDGAFYWPGVDRFLMFAGTVREVPNQFNLDWFFENLNFSQRQKVWVTKVPRYGEIWWFYPRGDASECTDAVIYNVREQVWYDAHRSRSAGASPQVFRFPVWADSEPNASGKYSLWLHEFGKNRVKGSAVTALRSSYTTHELGFPTGGPTGEAAAGEDRWTRSVRFEPNFVQAGDLRLEFLGQKYASSPADVYDAGTFGPSTEKLDFRVQNRNYRVRVTSDEIDGDYYMGAPLLHVEAGDARQ